MTEPRDHPDDIDLVWPDAAVLAHVGTCGSCRDRSDRLAASQDGVRRSLAPLAGPVPIPAEVAARVVQALAREGATPAAGVSASSALRSVDGDELAARRAAGAEPPRRPRLSRWLLAAAASAAVVVVGAGLVLPRLGGQDDLSAQRADTESAPGAEGGDEAGSDAAAEAAPGTGGDAGSTAGSGAEPGGGPPAVLVPGVAPLPADLLAEAAALTPPGTAAAGCGTELAASVAGTVTAAADPAVAADRGVLVLLTVAGEATGQAWWLPSCTATPDTALGASPLPQP